MTCMQLEKIKHRPHFDERLNHLNPYQIEVMITSLIDVLQLPNFVHITASTIKLESRDKILVLTSQTKVMTS